MSGDSSQFRPSASTRRLRRWVGIYFVIAFLLMIWPVYPIFSRIRPLLLGLPFSLFYLVSVLLISFFVILGLYVWESRHGELE